MEVRTTRFGTLNIADDRVITFPKGLLGFGQATRYCLLEPTDDACFFWLQSIDDRYPVLASGDVVELEFDAGALPPLPEGWARDYCFTTEGWVKDADLNQAVREDVRPLPFHGMSAYPYDEAKEAHPHPDFVREWFTRPARALVNPEALR